MDVAQHEYNSTGIHFISMWNSTSPPTSLNTLYKCLWVLINCELLVLPLGINLCYYKGEEEYKSGENFLQRFNLTGAEAIPDVDVSRKKFAMNIILPSSDETGEIRLLFESVSDTLVYTSWKLVHSHMVESNLHHLGTSLLLVSGICNCEDHYTWTHFKLMHFKTYLHV